jgi:hypothetical protein
MPVEWLPGGIRGLSADQEGDGRDENTEPILIER